MADVTPPPDVVTTACGVSGLVFGSVTHITFDLHPVTSFFGCFFLAFGYVSSLYIKETHKGRDHPYTVKVRFLAVTVACFLAIPFIYFLSSTDYEHGFTLWQWLGIKWRGFLPSLFLPLILTMVLFLGPLVQQYDAGVFEIYRESEYWKKSLNNVYFIRNHIMGPLTEEFLFRACLMPLMVPVFGWRTAVCFCPVFFGVAHFHHMLQKIKYEGLEFKVAFFQQIFQFTYTTIFGIYCAFVFVRTGHLLGPVLCHAFANHMGLPDIDDLLNEEDFDKKARLFAFYLAGPILFFLLLNVLTTPWIYGNEVYSSYLYADIL